MSTVKMELTRDQLINMLELFQDWQCDHGYLAVREDDDLREIATAFMDQQDQNERDHKAAYGS